MTFLLFCEASQNPWVLRFSNWWDVMPQPENPSLWPLKGWGEGGNVIPKIMLLLGMLPPSQPKFGLQYSLAIFPSLLVLRCTTTIYSSALSITLFKWDEA